MENKVHKGIDELHKQLQALVGQSVSRDDVIEVLSQHVTLSKVFHALFQGDYESHNPVAQELDRAVEKLDLTANLSGLDDFYDEAIRELGLATTRTARQNFIRKLYENFYKSLDSKEQTKHGIVFTPIEIVDFIIQSTSYLLKKTFNLEFGDSHVKVIDPFTGTGSFIVRLLESGLIPPERLHKKYQSGIFANDIKLLSYYVAAVNIETTYASLKRPRKHVDFPGINYTDTFEVNPEYRDMSPADRARFGAQSALDGQFKAAHDRVRQQRAQHIHVIMGNPPYKADMDIKYGYLDQLIKTSYEEKLYYTEKKNKKLLYNSYIRALRWASSRLGRGGIVSFVTSGSFIRSGIGTGIRASLESEFNEIWCFDLRGDQNTHGEYSDKEGGKIFGSKSKQPVAITFLIKIPGKKGCKIYYKNIGDSLDRKQKIKIVSEYGTIENIPQSEWIEIKPDNRHDWLEQSAADNFFKYLVMGTDTAKSNKSKDEKTLFKIYSGGVKTACDTVAYNSDVCRLKRNINRHIKYCQTADIKLWTEENTDKTQCVWDSMLVQRMRTGRPPFKKSAIRRALYRPFFPQYIYFDPAYNQAQYRISEFFPTNKSTNLVICISTKTKGDFSAIVTNMIPDLHVIGTGQCFPLYRYNNGVRIDNITKLARDEFWQYYSNNEIKKCEIFDYIYAMLHHPGYKSTFKFNLKKYIPRIPFAPNFADFNTFKNIGRDLRILHTSFESCTRASLGKQLFAPKEVESLSLQHSADKKTVSVYGDNELLFKDVPQPKYEVNGRTPLACIADRYKLTVKHDTWVNNPCKSTNMIAHIERAVYIGQESDRLIKLLPNSFEPLDDWSLSKGSLDEHLDS